MSSSENKQQTVMETDSTTGGVATTSTEPDPSKLVVHQQEKGVTNVVHQKSSSHEMRGRKRSSWDEKENDSDNESGDDEYNEEEEEVFGNMDDLNEKMRHIWKSLDLELACDETGDLVQQEISSLVQDGQNAFHRLESTKRQLVKLQEECQAKTIEIQRLRLTEENQRKSIQNLLRTVETGKAESREISKRAVAEAQLRAQLGLVTQEKNEALLSARTNEAKSSLLEEQLRQAKTKLVRATQEKIQFERDQRCTLSLAKSLESHEQSHGTLSGESHEYYKRKTSELTVQVSGLEAALAAKNRRVQDLERQLRDSNNSSSNKPVAAEVDENPTSDTTNI